MTCLLTCEDATHQHVDIGGAYVDPVTAQRIDAYYVATLISPHELPALRTEH